MSANSPVNHILLHIDGGVSGGYVAHFMLKKLNLYALF